MTLQNTLSIQAALIGAACASLYTAALLTLVKFVGGGRPR